MFAQATGLRRREVVNLTWSQVDWGAGIIRVVQKGERGRRIPLFENAGSGLARDEKFLTKELTRPFPTCLGRTKVFTHP